MANFDNLSLGGLFWFASHRSNTSSMSATLQSCSLEPSPAEAFCLLPIHLPSLPKCLLVIFCFTTENGKITRLITRLIGDVTRLLFSTFIEGADKGEVEFCFFFMCNTVQVVSVFTFVAADPFLLVNTICIDKTIGDVLHFKAHLVWGLNTTNEALPFECRNTLGMFIMIQMLSKVHSKEEKWKMGNYSLDI